MSVKINYKTTLVEAFKEQYSAGEYIKTLGFATAGDGGAATYRVKPEAKYTVNGESFYYNNGLFFKQFNSCLELIPQEGKIYAEQFGVLPDNPDYCSSNSTMMNRAVEYASQKGYVLAFASNKTYYFSSSITVKSNLFIDGNGATMRVHDSASNGCNLFNMANKFDLQRNVTVRNLTVVGRTNEEKNRADQAFHVCLEGFTLQNVNVKNFSFGIHTYGRSASVDYAQPPIVNKNWLIDNCTVTDTVMGFQLSEIDGITIKNSIITSIYYTGFPVGTYGDHSYYDGYEYPEAHIYDSLGGLHNIYLSANCLNVRIDNVILGNVTGDAVHKAYAVGDSDVRFDKSKNHFYTDLSIYKCNSPVNMGFISENVMCDNVFGTGLRYLVHLSAASNCIVSNSSLTVDRGTFYRPNAKNTSQINTINPNTGLYVESACSCWFQNSYLSTNGRLRATSSPAGEGYYYNMSIKPDDSTDENFVDKRHMRNFIGENFDIPNHWFKFTGCELISNMHLKNYYFYEDINRVASSDTAVPKIYQFGEYWDNCNFDTNTSEDLFYMYCINNLPGGLTIRNSYLKNINPNGTPKPPFRIYCWQEGCNEENNICKLRSNCLHAQYGKWFTSLHLENVAFKNICTNSYNSWEHIIARGGHLSSVNDAVSISNSYAFNCCKIGADSIRQMFED